VSPLLVAGPTGLRNTLLREQRDVMLVGHMPHLPHLLRALLAGEEEAAPVAFPQNGVVAIEMEPEGTCAEAWRLEPDPDK
jgi:phosphohistidine phosphatase SixA